MADAGRRPNCSVKSQHLSDVISAVYEANISMAERRRLAARAVACAMLPTAPGTVADPCSRSEDYEHVLDVASEALGSDVKLSVTAVKASLRRNGPPGVALAARIGKLSRLRNTEVHDTTLADEVACYLRKCDLQAAIPASGSGSGDDEQLAIATRSIDCCCSEDVEESSEGNAVDLLKLQLAELADRVAYLEQCVQRDALDCWFAEPGARARGAAEDELLAEEVMPSVMALPVLPLFPFPTVVTADTASSKEA